MPPTRRRNLVPRRRRRDDEGEEEGSAIGDVEDESLSEGSAISNGDEEADGEASDVSVEEVDRPPNEVLAKHPTSQQEASARPAPEDESISESATKFQASSDTKAILNGVKPSGITLDLEEIRFDDLHTDPGTTSTGAEVIIPKAPRNETLAQRSRREHHEYIKQRNSNPAFVPNRGGFFLHDDRSSLAPNNLPKPFARGRGRGINVPPQLLRPLVVAEPSEKQWAHDLHERHENLQKFSQKGSGSVDNTSKESHSAAHVPAAGPNRTFSFTSILGNVSVQVSLPGMSEKISVKNVTKKHHTLLPQHRPPLRRDKPVRISIPEEPPRYIFPSTERSFIFIPRALRPNQQTYSRGRGRGSFHGSRRTSIFGGSVYTPSVAMSRKSSMGASAVKSGLKSPAESNYASSVAAVDTRPIVRMPSHTPVSTTLQPAFAANGLPTAGRAIGMLEHANGGVSQSVRSNAMPMHQPRPQKAVSVAGIESPATFPFKAPQQQQEQPFHQQMPALVAAALADDGSSHAGQHTSSSHPRGTPLSHIPEGAVYANPFQPYPPLGAPTFYGGPFGIGPLFYPPSLSSGMPFSVPMPNGVMAPSFVPGSQTHPLPYGGPASGTADIGPPVNSMAHESNGMVYYYEPAPFTGEVQGIMAHFPAGANGAATGLGPVSAPSSYYYPSMAPGMFFPSQTG